MPLDNKTCSQDKPMYSDSPDLLLNALKDIKRTCNGRDETLAGIIYTIASNAVFEYETAKIKKTNESNTKRN